MLKRSFLFFFGSVLCLLFIGMGSLHCDYGVSGNALYKAGLLLPADQSGIRGFSMPYQDAGVTPPGQMAFSLDANAANTLIFESTAQDQWILDKYEDHALTFGIRQGYQWSPALSYELGAQLQWLQRDEGLMNAFITGTEENFSRWFGEPTLVNLYRIGYFPVGGAIDQIRIKSATRLRTASFGTRLDNILLSYKQSLFRRNESPGWPDISTRIVWSLPLNPESPVGSFLGAGMGLGGPILGDLLAGDLDLRVVLPNGTNDAMVLPLKPYFLGFTVGLAVNVSGQGVAPVILPEETAFVLQVNGTESPYQSTVLDGLNQSQYDLTFGFNHLIHEDGRDTLLQLYGRQDFYFDPKRNFFNLLAYAPPDFQAGIEIPDDG